MWSRRRLEAWNLEEYALGRGCGVGFRRPAGGREGTEPTRTGASRRVAGGGFRATVTWDPGDRWRGSGGGRSDPITRQRHVVYLSSISVELCYTAGEAAKYATRRLSRRILESHVHVAAERPDVMYTTCTAFTVQSDANMLCHFQRRLRPESYAERLVHAKGRIQPRFLPLRARQHGHHHHHRFTPEGRSIMGHHRARPVHAHDPIIPAPHLLALEVKVAGKMSGAEGLRRPNVPTTRNAIALSTTVHSSTPTSLAMMNCTRIRIQSDNFQEVPDFFFKKKTSSSYKQFSSPQKKKTLYNSHSSDR